MQIDGWRYYNHAALPSTAPHEAPDPTPINDGSIWKLDGAPLLARWTTEFDCGYETNWWYVIKDTPFDLSMLKAKRRYEITRGNKNFYVKEINPRECAEDIFRVSVAAYAEYPKSYRPNLVHDEFVRGVKNWNFYRVYGAYSVDDDSLCGYACLNKHSAEYINFTTMKAVPESEKRGLNAAVINKILLDHTDFLNSNGYICDGARNIYHETAFQSYLEKYFGFRKAYCNLHITYRPLVKLALNVAYPFRKLLRKMSSVILVGQLNSLLQMEEIKRTKIQRG